jgi:hypothetical protein
LVSLPALAERWGKSIKTVGERWPQDEALEMPKFTYIRGRRYMTAGQALEWEQKLPSLLAKNKRRTGYALNRAKREDLQPHSVRMVRE